MTPGAAAVALLLPLLAATSALAQNSLDCSAIAALTGSDDRSLRTISIRTEPNGVQLFHRRTRINLPLAESCDFDVDTAYGVTLECRWRSSRGGLSSIELFDAVDGELRRCLGTRLSPPADPPEPLRAPNEGDFDIVQQSRAELPSRHEEAIEVQVQRTQSGITLGDGARIWLSIHVPTTDG